MAQPGWLIPARHTMRFGCARTQAAAASRPRATVAWTGKRKGFDCIGWLLWIMDALNYARRTPHKLAI